MAEKFAFAENITAVGAYRVAKHKPQPNTAIVEVLDLAGRVLCMDVFAATEAAPQGSVSLKPIIATLVRPGDTNICHQEFECSIDESPLQLPQHLLDKRLLGGARVRIWWSCEKA